MWFKVDDKFHVNRKTRRLLRLNPAKRRDSHAAGLWLLAGCWCMNAEAADGFVPADELDQFDDDWERLADQLCEPEVGLWERAEHKGEKGYQFHDWETWQPIFELKAKRAEAGRIGGLASAKVRASKRQASAEAKPKQSRSKGQANASRPSEPKQNEALASEANEANGQANEASAQANGKQAEANRQANPTSAQPSPAQPMY